MATQQPPIGIPLSDDVEQRPDRPSPFRARVRWIDPDTGKRLSLSKACDSEEEAAEWIDDMKRAAAGGIDPSAAMMSLGDYGATNMKLALRGLEPKTTDPYLAPGGGNVPFQPSVTSRCG